MNKPLRSSERIQQADRGSSRGPVQGRRQSRTDARRKEILRAALHCFTTVGFSSATLADIRVRARTSIGSIYHHFTSKEQLAATLYIEGLRDYQARFLAELDRHRRAREVVHGVVCEHLQWVKRNPDWSRFLYDHRQSDFVGAAEGALKELNEGFYRASAARWQHLVGSGEIIELPRDLMIAILLGPAQEFARNWLAGRTRTDFDDAARLLADAAWRALRSSPAMPRLRGKQRSGAQTTTGG